MSIESNINQILAWFNVHPAASIALLVWSLAWKGFALWRSAELRQKYWFIALLVLNTLGLLDIFYIFVVSRGYEVEVIEK